MEYEFKPLSIWRVKNDRKFRFNLNISTHDFCNSSVGISILIQVTFFRFNLSFCIKPFGEFKFN